LFVRDYFYVEDGAAAYMHLAEQLAARPDELRGHAFNFSNENPVAVLQIVADVTRLMGSKLAPDIRNEANHEIRKQFLSAAKARKMLNWRPLFSLNDGLEATVRWYRDFITHE
jgi:CDP-glucose 4,6-dehydratase